MGRGKSDKAQDYWARFKELCSKDFSVSNSTGIKQSTLSTYKEYNRFPRADEAVDIAKVLGVTVEAMVYGKEGED